MLKTIGRPSKLTPDIVEKLEEAFKLGVSDTLACEYSMIHRSTFYRHLESDKDFATKIASAKMYPRLIASQLVLDAIINKQDVSTARWWLEKKYPEEFSGGKIQLSQNNMLSQQNNYLSLTDFMSAMRKRIEENEDE